MSQLDRETGLVGYSGVKVPVRVASTAALTLSGEQTIDGVACVTDDRVLVKDQADDTENGIYIVDTGDWSRSPDADGPYDFVQGSLVLVFAGSTYGGLAFVQSEADPLPGTSSLNFTASLFAFALPLAIAAGGTGAATAAAAIAALGGIPLSIFTGDAATIRSTGSGAASQLAKGTALQHYRMNAAADDIEWAARAATVSEIDQPITGGTIVTSLDLTTITSGTVTPDPGDRPQQHYINGGAHTLGVSANAGSILVDITNNGSAGAITTSAFTKVIGDPFTTTNGHKFRCYISIGNAGSLLSVVALQ